MRVSPGCSYGLVKLGQGERAAVVRIPQELMVAWTQGYQGGGRLILGLVKVELTGDCGE